MELYRATLYITAIVDSPLLRCRKPDEQVILDYDYTFTTPYAGSQSVDNEEVCFLWFYSLRLIRNIQIHVFFLLFLRFRDFVMC